MFISRVLRNTMGATGNRLMYDSKPPTDRQMLYGAAGLAALTGLVYWTGYKAEGTSKASREHRKEMEAQLAANRTQT